MLLRNANNLGAFSNAASDAVDEAGTAGPRTAL